jgi:pseudaminic acid cytidylyltransferase
MNLCLIPARCGSKRIPKKNIKNFHGKPLIAYSIENALKSGIFDTVVVSTDCEEIADVAKKWGAEVQFRPPEISDDYAGLDKVSEYVLNEYRGYEYMCLLFATAPLLDYKYLIKAYETLKSSDAVYALSVVEFEYPIFRGFEIVNGRLRMFWPENYFKRSQDLPKAFHDAGIFSFTALNRKPKSSITFSEDAVAVILPKWMGVDIDTPEDFEMAELIYEGIKKREQNLC